mmetsp:Transcript_27005/g.39111  ORF Transcript_27005/g.39111 Transcript_27005/m.39111 type:complete len:657 (+) Transcript_27005:148-2118(+)
MEKLYQTSSGAFRRSNVLYCAIFVILLQNSFVSAKIPSSESTRASRSCKLNQRENVTSPRLNSKVTTFVSPLRPKECAVKNNRRGCEESFLTQIDTFPTKERGGGELTLFRFRRNTLSPSSTPSAFSPHGSRRTKEQVFRYYAPNDSWEEEEENGQFKKRRTHSFRRLHDIFSRNSSSRRRDDTKHRSQKSVKLRAVANEEKLSSTDSKMKIQVMGVIGEIERQDYPFSGNKSESHYSDLKLNALEIEQNIDVEKIAPMSTIEESFENVHHTEVTPIQQEHEMHDPAVEFKQSENNSTMSHLSTLTAKQQDNVKKQPRKKKKGVIATNHASEDELSWVAKYFQRLLQRTIQVLLCRWSVFPPHKLTIVSNPRGNILSRLISRGEILSDVQINFERLVFHNLRMSGGRIDIKRMSLKILANVPSLRRVLGNKKIHRFPSPFEFHAQDCIFTQDDILQSPCIQNGIQNLLNHILNKSGFLSATSVTVSSVKILVRREKKLNNPNYCFCVILFHFSYDSPLNSIVTLFLLHILLGVQSSKKVSCEGKAITALGTQVPFEVRTGLGVSSRGHVLLLPGLEIALNPAFPFQMFVPVVPEVDVDLGHNAQIESLIINGKRGKLSLSARATVTPRGENRLNYSQQKSSYLAQYSCDVGKWIKF